MEYSDIPYNGIINLFPQKYLQVLPNEPYMLIMYRRGMTRLYVF